MLDLSKLREHAKTLIAEASDTAALEKAAVLTKLVEEIANEQASTGKLLVERSDIILRQRHEGRGQWKDLLERVTPLLTTLILAGTLVFQAYTFRQSERDKLDDAKRQSDLAEKARWTDALKLLSQSENESPASSLLSSFTTMPYSGYAHNYAISLLSAKDNFPNEFKDLFRLTFEPVNSKSLPELISLNRRLEEEANPILLKDWNESKQDNEVQKLTAKEKALLASVEADLVVVDAALVTLLKSPRPNYNSKDFGNMYFSKVDLSNTDWSGFDVRYSNFSSSRFDGADLNVANCEGATFTDAPWWHASKISLQCLAYLTKEYPFKLGSYYAETSPSPSREDYQSSLKRLNER